MGGGQNQETEETGDAGGSNPDTDDNTRLEKPLPNPTPQPDARDREYDRALAAEEASRARGWSLIIIALGISAGTFTLFVPAHPGAELAFRLTLCVLWCVAVWTYWRARDERTYTRNVFRVFGWVSAVAALPVTYYVGVFSPAPLIVTLGIIFFGLGTDRVHAIAIPVVATTSYVVMTALIAGGVIPDLGLIRGDGLPNMTKLFVLVNIPAIYAVALWFARVSRRSMIEAIDRTNRALVLANQREAQFDEAREDLEQILRAAAGRDGVFSGRQAGDYILAEVIGRGGMGEVYAAEHPSGDRRIAVKVLRPDAAIKPGVLERFLREGELASKLESPNIVEVIEVGRLSRSVPYIAMELLEGEDLAAKLRHSPRLELDEVVDLVGQISQGLVEAHAADIVHRDIKPKNLFEAKDPATRAGTWKLLDFGVSKLRGSTGTLTHQAIVGTPKYMSPEQAQGNEVDARSDIFSFGAVAYRALTGTPPFKGKDPPTVLYDIVYGLPQPPSLVMPELSSDIDAVFSIVLAKRPADRFPDATAFADALLDARRGNLSSKLRRRGRDVFVAQYRRITR